MKLTMLLGILLASVTHAADVPATGVEVANLLAKPAVAKSFADFASEVDSVETVTKGMENGATVYTFSGPAIRPVRWAPMIYFKVKTGAAAASFGKSTPAYETSDDQPMKAP